MMLEEYKSHLNFVLDFMKEEIKKTKRMVWLPDTTLAGAADDEGILQKNLRVGKNKECDTMNNFNVQLISIIN